MVMWRIALAFVLAAMGAGCSLVQSSRDAEPVPVASAKKLGILRESFANPHEFRRAASMKEVDRRFPISLVRPNAPLASDRTIDSAWISNADTSGEKSLVLFWNSGVVETFERWRCNCEAAASLREMGGRKPFRFLMLRGAPAMTDPSFPGQASKRMVGLVSAAEAAYGRPATVETIRDGYNITLWQYGPGTQLGLLAAAQTLPVAHTTFGVHGYEGGGQPLGDWNGPQGIDVAPQGGATFGIGVALENITSDPVTITGVHALNGFIRLIGIHFRPYTPSVGGDAIGPPIVHKPYDRTPGRLDYALKPGTWVGVQLDFQVRSPCIHWSSTTYDRTVEVTFTQSSRVVHIQEVPMVPLNISGAGAC